MTNDITIQAYLSKASENLASANSELANDRFNACANRAYYSCFQAGIVALLRAGIRAADEWGHDFVQAQFAGVLITRRKLYPSDLRDTLSRLESLRETADYEAAFVSRTQAARAFRRAQEFVAAVQERGERR